jgi:pimeloyl-ACP methyl ester carboxylesterase
VSPPADGPPRTPVAREVLNTIQVGPVPVIVIPGVMGSRVRMRLAGAPVTWDPDNGAALALLVAMPIGAKVSLFSSEGEVIQDPRPEGFPEVAWGFYGPLITDLVSSLPQATLPVYALGYDWRKSNDESGKVIAQRVTDILTSLNAKKAILVTHSMGGLVARAALRYVPGFEAKVLGVVHCVQPVLGAAKNYANFVRGPHESGGVGFGLNQILGPWAWQFLANMTTMAGPVQLLPNNDYRLPSSGAVAQPPADLTQPVSVTEWLQAYGDDGQWGFSADVFDVYRGYGIPGVVQRWQPKMLPHFFGPAWGNMMDRMDDLLLTAKGFHDQLKGYQHPLTKTLVSQVDPATELGTISFTHEGLLGTSTSYGQFSGPGDGTVPYMSQSALPGTPGWPDPVTRVDGLHSDIFKIDAARDFVKKCILAMVSP